MNAPAIMRDSWAVGKNFLPSRAAVIETVERDYEQFLDELIVDRPLTYEDGSERRYGSRGSLRIDMLNFSWRSFEAGEGGKTLKLIQFIRRCSEAEAWKVMEAFCRDRELADAPEIGQVSAEVRAANAAARLAKMQAEGRERFMEIGKSYGVVHPVTGPALLYLKNRGIEPPEEIRVNLPIMTKKFTERSKTDWRHHALMFLLQDDAGQIQGAQYIRLTAEGRRVVTADHQKKTIGCRHGAAVRFKVNGYNGPLYLTEGGEDALTVFLHGDVECWSLLGALEAGAIERLGIDRDRPLVLVADNDQPGSDADRLLRWTVRDLRAAGRHVSVLRAPQSCKDVNAWLMKVGPDRFRQKFELIKDRLSASS